MSRATRDQSLDASYHLAAFVGRYVQDHATGGVVDAGFILNQRLDKQRLRLDLEYGFDSFSTKTFNFSDEDQSAGQARLVQATHEVSIRPGWRTHWSRSVVSGVSAELAFSRPEFARDRRVSLSARPWLRLGRNHGWYAELSSELVYKKYPNYLVSQRRIDQKGAEVLLGLGYGHSSGLALECGLEWRATQYLESRYDTLDAVGRVVPATKDKSYRSTSPYAVVTANLAKPLKLSLKYEYERNDSINYDRRVVGRNVQGGPLAKFVPDYYDYARHRLGYRARVNAFRRLVLKHVVDFWVRDFATYEARDADDIWKGELRHDTNVEQGLEVSWRLTRFRALGLPHGVFVTAFGSHLVRRSNMQREVSLATNFEITRLFAGVELRGL